jgi:hypothetical protein
MVTGLTVAQRDLLDRITPALGKAFGERVLIAPDQSSLFVRRGSIGVRLDIGDGANMLQHAVFAESVSDGVLIRLVRVIADTADALDAEIRGRFG